MIVGIIRRRETRLRRPKRSRNETRRWLTRLDADKRDVRALSRYNRDWCRGQAIQSRGVGCVGVWKGLRQVFFLDLEL